MNTYEEKCLQLDKELAEALGWTSITEINKMFSGNVATGYEYVPRWTQDDGECFRLMVEHGLQVMVDIHPDGCDCVEVEDDITQSCWVFGFESFTDRYACVRFAICSAVLAKLKGK